MIPEDAQYKQLRVTKSYKNVDIILFCFDVNNITSLQNISSIWLPEVQQFAPQTVIKLLVGLKADLRANQSIISQNTLIPTDKITQFRESHPDQFMDYIEASALKKIRLQEAFEIGIQHFFALEHKHRKSSTRMRDYSVDQDPSDVVGTHKKQWNAYLRDQGGGSVFSQFTNNTNNTNRGRDDTNFTQYTHPIQPSMPMNAAAMSYQSGQYNMSAMSIPNTASMLNMTAMNGSTRSMNMNQGSMRNLNMNHGSMRNMNMNNGSMRNMNANHGSMRNMNMNNGSMRNMNMNQGSMRNMNMNQGSMRNMNMNQGSTRNMNNMSYGAMSYTHSDAQLDHNHIIVMLVEGWCYVDLTLLGNVSEDHEMDEVSVPKPPSKEDIDNEQQRGLTQNVIMES